MVVNLLEPFASKERPPANIYSMRGLGEVIDNRVMKKAVYCTCWDGHIVVSVNQSGTQLRAQSGGR